MYDDIGAIGLELNGIIYYYIRNLSGDVTKIVDASGNTVVQYTYDTWGKVLSTTGSLASTVGAKNPIRYRGYYYDAETGLYSVGLRYYDPEVGRWISPDNVNIALEAREYNLYAYCLNDPVNRVDTTGCVSIILLQINWKIEIGKDEFSFTNQFRKKKTYKFDDIEVKLLSRSTRIYNNGKHIVGISYIQENWAALENSIAAYQKSKKRKANH